LLHGKKNARFEVHLKGPGAPRAPWTGDTYFGDGHYVRGRSLVGRKEGPAVFESSAYKPGTYALELVYAGRKLATRTFKLIKMPTKFGYRDLEVDFSAHAYGAYARPTQYSRIDFIVNVPADLRRPSTRYVLVTFKDGSYQDKQIKEVKTYDVTERFVRRPFYETSVQFSLYSSLFGNRRSGYSGEIDLLLLRDSGEFLKSWHISGSSVTPFKMSFKDAFLGTVVSAKPPAKVVAKARAIARKAWQQKREEAKKSRFPEKLFQVRREQPLCAVVQDRKAFALINNLAELGHSTYSLADRHATASKVLKSRYSTRKERAAARRERRAMVSGAVKTKAAVRKLKAKLSVILRRYRPGCFRKLFPPSMQALIAEKVVVD
jgi:hypothetical protein